MALGRTDVDRSKADPGFSFSREGTMNQSRLARLCVGFGRVLFTAALLALIGAWITQATGESLFGMSQQHLFSDAIVLSLLGIGSFLDALWHARTT